MIKLLYKFPVELHLNYFEIVAEGGLIVEVLEG